MTKNYRLVQENRFLTHLSQVANGIKLLHCETMVLSIKVQPEKKPSHLCQKPMERLLFFLQRFDCGCDW